MILFLQLLTLIAAQECNVKSPLQNIYPISQEVYTIPLNQLFTGTNLTFDCPDCPIQIFNYITNMTNQTTLGIYENNIAQIPISYDINGEYLAILTQNVSNYYIQLFVYLSQDNPIYLSSFNLYQSDVVLYCYSAIFTINDAIIVSCYGGGNLSLYFVNWENSVELINFPFEYNLSITYTKMQYFQEQLVLGVFTDKQDFIYIFQCEYGFPKNLTSYLNSTIIPYLNIADFNIADNSSLYVLNITKYLYNFNLSNGIITLIKDSLVFPSSDWSLLGFELFIDWKHNNTHYIFILNDLPYLNVQEFMITDDLIPVGLFDMQTTYVSYQSRVYFCISDAFLIVYQHLGQQAYFQRSSSQFTELRYKDYWQGYLTQRSGAQLIFLNPLYNTILYIGESVYVAQLSFGLLAGYFSDLNNKGVITINANSQLGSKSSKCFVTLNYQVILTNDTNLYAATESDELPKQSLFPKNQTFNLNTMFSGPFIQANGTIVNAPTSISPSQFYQVTVTEIKVILKNYPPSNIDYGKTVYNSLTQTVIQMLVQGTVIYGYICQDLDNLYCDNLFLNIDSTTNITDIELTFPSLQNDKLVYAFDQGPSTIVVCDLNLTDREVNSNQLGIIILDYRGQLLNYTSFILLGDRLYVVLESVAQIWVIDVFNILSYPLAIISALNFTIPFTPSQIVGNYELYGQLLFINNQNQFLIIEYGDEHVELLYQGEYIYNYNESWISLVGNNLIIAQYDNSSQQFLQYNIDNPNQPYLIKSFPNYGIYDSKKPIVNDNIFIYMPTIEKQVVVYNPTLSYHSCLFQLFTFDYNFLTTTSSKLKSFILYGYNQNITNEVLLPNPSLTFIPGYYSTAYQTSITYLINVWNDLSTSVYNFSQNMTVYNSQLGILVNQSQFNTSNNNFLISKKGISIFDLNLTNSVIGDVAMYGIECDTCTNSTKFSITNHLSRSIQKIGKLRYITQIINYPPLKSAFVQNSSQIYLVNQDFNTTLVYNFTYNFSQCYSLNYNILDQSIVSVCEVYDSKEMYFVQYLVNISNGSVNLTQGLAVQVTGTSNIQNVYLFNSFLIYNGIYNQKYSAINIFEINENKMSLKYTTLCIKGVNDYELVPIYNYTINGTQFIQILTFYTCDNQVDVFYLSGLIINGTIYQEKDSQMLNTSLQAFWLQDTQAQQVQLLNIDEQNITLLITSNNVMSVIFNVSYNRVQTQNLTFVPLENLTIITTIPPYGTFKQANSLSYADGLLVLNFYFIDSERYLSFLSVYDLTNVTQLYNQSIPLLMIGGIYQPATQAVFGEQYTILSPYQNATSVILVTDYFESQNLGSIVLQPQISLIANVSEEFGSKQMYLVAENYFTKEIISIEVSYPISQQLSGLPWWSWLVILLGLVAGGSCITVILVKCKSEDDTEYNELEL